MLDQGSPHKLPRKAGFVLAAIRAVSNWPRFVLSYRGVVGHRATYRMRQGPVIAASAPEDARTIAEVFIGNEYGSVAGLGTVVDVGAHIGSFALYAAYSPGVNQVYCCEPSPQTFQFLVENIARNTLQDRIFPFRIAVGAETVTRPLYVSPLSTQFSLVPPRDGAAGSTVSVDCVKLDDLFPRLGLSSCDLLKMDIEGAEFEALLTASEETLAVVRRIRMEYHDRRSRRSISELASFLESRGFSITLLTSDREFGGLLWAERPSSGR